MTKENYKGSIHLNSWFQKVGSMITEQRCGGRNTRGLKLYWKAGDKENVGNGASFLKPQGPLPDTPLSMRPQFLILLNTCPINW